ncbi:MAG: glycoside hydrolase family 44 protein, partial [Polyangiaceae bacterium]
MINASMDWFFENRASPSVASFLAENAAHGVESALTVPILGWVAKDATSYAFPVSIYGPQAKTDPWHADAGNGVSPSGAKIPPGPPTRTSVPASPEWIKEWVSTIVAGDKEAGARSVHEYILDNEPMLWSQTHRDVRPEPLGYDELLDRTIRYGTAIREADPNAIIAGPASWGWSGYFFSAKDLAARFGMRPDRRDHDNVPLVEWYLRKLREYEEKTGVRVLDVLDLHYYPQADGVYGGGTGGTDPKTAALRLRSTRSLWDPSYVDESWIHESVRLLPMMKEWIARDYPGRAISIGEWNFGGEGHITGALATAEALGRFAEYGVRSAFYWAVPPIGSPSIQGFLAFRNFDGKGGRFLDWGLPTKETPGVSFFVSRDAEGKHLVAVAINMSPTTAKRAEIDVHSCGVV